MAAGEVRYARRHVLVDAGRGHRAPPPAFSLSVDKSFAGIQRFDLAGAAETRAWLADLSAQAGARAEGCDDLCEHATRAVTLVTCTGNFAGGRARTLTVFVG